MNASDVMTRDVISVPPDMTVASIAQLLLQHGISAVPVVDAGGKVIGVVSEGDLMRRPESDTERRRSWWLELFTDNATLVKEYAKTYGLTADDVMTRHVIQVTDDTPCHEIAALLETHGIKRVLVTREGRLVGIVSRANLLQLVASAPRTVSTPASEDDGTIRERVTTKLRRLRWVPHGKVNVIASDGVVHLWGQVRSDDERVALRVAAANVPGVHEVKDHLRLMTVRVRGLEL